MTIILFERFKKKFPESKGHRISTYEGNERIYLTLLNRAFIGMLEFNDKTKIDGLAKKIFDVDFFWGETHYGSPKDNVPTIMFNPKILPKKEGGTIKQMRYQQHYSEHSIEIILPSTFPQITINTGNRGRAILLETQRKKYYNFVEGVYNLFLENARK